jgi:hypothetical protein
LIEVKKIACRYLIKGANKDNVQAKESTNKKIKTKIKTKNSANSDNVPS